MIKNILLILAYLISNGMGLLLIKLGSGKTEIALNSNKLMLSVSWQTISGLGLYGVGFILYLVLLSKFSISYITPLLGGLAYVIMFILAVTVLKEKIYTTQIFGIFLIIFGVIMLNFHNKG